MLTPEEREAYVLTYQFPVSVAFKVRRDHPEITDEQYAIIEVGLRQWLVACVYRTPGTGTLAMPSMSVDWAWHEFILCTRQYIAFCEQAYGGNYLHHTPAPEMQPGEDSGGELRTQEAWAKSQWALALRESVGEEEPREFYTADAMLGLGHTHQ
jgi:hypothetical protein